MYLMLFVERFFCFFKHKTAYEMRISDWSSDVCSSDLWRRSGRRFGRRSGRHFRRRRSPTQPGGWRCTMTRRTATTWTATPGTATTTPAATRSATAGRRGTRSEEHTSELQSLMRISYAVFCCKKTNNKYSTADHTHYDRKS